MRTSSSTLGGLLAVFLASGGPARAGDAICPGCLVWEVPSARAATLLGSTARLDGLRLLIADGSSSTAEALTARGADVGVRIAADPPASDPLPAWLVVRPDSSDAVEALAFRLKALTSDLRARRDGIRLGLEAPAPLVERLAALDVGAYFDFVLLPAGPAPPAFPEAWRRASIDSLEAAARASADATVVADWPSAEDVPLAWARLGSELGPDPLPAGRPRWRCAALDREVACRVRAFRTADALAVWVDADEPVARLQGAGTAVGASSLEGGPIAVRADGGALALEPPTRSLVVRVAAEDPRFRDALEVTAERSLTAAEILARHRAAEQARRRRVPRLIATGDTTITFALPGLSAPAVVTARTILYEDGARREVEQQDLRWNGAAVPLDRGRVPRLPIVEPAAAEPPLAIRLTEAYAYRLAGREEVEGRRAYVLAFEPREGEGPRGRAWIDAADFGLVRLHTMRAGLPGPIVSSEQGDAFERTDVGGRPVWLLARSDIHQTYEGPGHRTPIHRRVRFTRLEPNPPDFQARRDRAHQGDAVLMRETPDGFRYLAAGDAPGERRLGGRSGSVRTVALGLTVDPNVDGPLPFGGLGYLDLDLFGTGAQFNGFVGAGFLQASFTRPRLGGSRWQLNGAGLVVFVRYNDRAFRQGVEQYGETVRQRPSRASLGVARPLSGRSRVRLSYELEHNALGRSDLADADFATPADVMAHGLRAELEARRGAWTAVAFGSAHRRTGWEAWGRRASPEPVRAGYERFGVSLARSLVATPRLTARVEASWTDGRRLDRFSRYAVDSFLNRLRGYPAGSLRYDRGLVLRGQASAALVPGLRADVFLDQGLLHDPGYGEGLRSYPGLGLGLELALGRGLLVAGEAGFAFAGRDRQGEKGTRSFQVTAVKTF